jgi:hypothetical protein
LNLIGETLREAAILSSADAVPTDMGLSLETEGCHNRVTPVCHGHVVPIHAHGAGDDRLAADGSSGFVCLRLANATLVVVTGNDNLHRRIFLAEGLRHRQQVPREEGHGH